MGTSKHKISRAKAKKLSEQFAAKKKTSKCFKQIPDGFLFDADEVRKLLRHSRAKYFIVKMGLKVSTSKGQVTETLTPILFITDENYVPIPEAATTPTDPSTTANLRMSVANETGDADEGGGFLDESNPIPPPFVEV